MGLKLLYFIVLYTNPTRNVFQYVKHQISILWCKMYTRHEIMSKFIENFLNVYDAIAMVWDAMLYTEQFGVFKVPLTRHDIHTLYSAYNNYSNIDLEINAVLQVY